MTIADTKTQAPLAAASTKPPARRRSLLLSPWLLVLAGQLGLTIAFFAAWEALIRFGFLKVYLYGQPSGIIQKFWKLLIDGSLIADTAITAYESVLGFAVGSFLGPDEKASFAKALRLALQDAKRGPTYNPL